MHGAHIYRLSAGRGSGIVAFIAGLAGSLPESGVSSQSRCPGGRTLLRCRHGRPENAHENNQPPHRPRRRRRCQRCRLGRAAYSDGARHGAGARRECRAAARGGQRRAHTRRDGAQQLPGAQGTLRCDHSPSVAAARAILAEDEPLLREELAELLASLWPELDIVAQAADGIAALQAVERHAPDILFLDINMPGLNGLEVARQASGRCHVVFVTAYDQHTLAAFEQGAADYLLKPVQPARLATTVARLKERIGRPPPALEGLLRELGARASGYLRWINASQGQTVRVLTVEDVCYFQADSKYTRVVTPEGESLIRKPIKELSQELDPASFWQIHRSTIVNVHAIAGVVRDLRGRTQVRLKRREEVLQVSDAYTALFRQM